MDKMIRPKAIVLPDSAQLPARNIIQPPPNQFTHEVVADQAYYYIGPDQAAPPEGKFTVGTKVVLLRHEGGPECWVADGRGLYVATAFDGLRALS